MGKNKGVYIDNDTLKVPELNHVAVVYSCLPDNTKPFLDLIKQYNVTLKDQQTVSDLIDRYTKQVIKVRGIFNTIEDAQLHASQFKSNKFDISLLEMNEWCLSPTPLDPEFDHDKQIDYILTHDMLNEQLKSDVFEKRKSILTEYGNKLASYNQDDLSECKRLIREKLDIPDKFTDMAKAVRTQERVLEYDLDGFEVHQKELVNYEKKKDLKSMCKQNQNYVLVSFASNLSNQKYGNINIDFEPFLNQYGVNKKDKKLFYEKIEMVTRVAFSVIGGFDTEDEAQEHVADLIKKHDTFNMYIQPMYSWKIMPPEPTKDVKYSNETLNSVFENKKGKHESMFT